MNRRRWIVGTFACNALLAPAIFLLPGAAQPPSRPTDLAEPLTEERVVEQVKRATDHALSYLAAKQRGDGAWHNNNAVNALALLAFMGRGHTPGRGPYKDVLDKGKKFLLASQRGDGYTSFGTMYEHGLATLALVEMYGMDADPALEEKTRKAVDLILACQSEQGGWNYGSTPVNGDLSVSVMQIVAMRAAENAGIPVPAKHIRKAVDYLHQHADPKGGYGYAGPGQGPQTSAAGALSLQLLGQFDDPNIPRTLEYLSAFRPRRGPDGTYRWDGQGAQYFFYFHYYAIQAHYQAGGKYWNDWHPAIRAMLLERQNADGSWDVPPRTAETEASVGPNRVYSTALGTLVLEIYLHYLPGYQR